MPRRLRLHVPNGFYHVTLRGNHRQAIFFRDSDRTRLDEIVAETLERYSARLHAYCWMTNHLHFLLQVSDQPLGRLIQAIASRYARLAQSAIQTTGHLFERRYHAVLVDADAYLLTLLKYIHLNPVRAGLAPGPGAYPWTSHHDYVGSCIRPWVTTKTALVLLSPKLQAARARYAEMIGQSPELRWRDGDLQTHRDNDQVMGNDAFLARVAPDPRNLKTTRTLDELLEECTQRFGLGQAELASPGRNRQLSAARAWLSAEAVANGVATIAEVARKLDRTQTAVRRLMLRHRSNRR